MSDLVIFALVAVGGLALMGLARLIYSDDSPHSNWSMGGPTGFRDLASTLVNFVGIAALIVGLFAVIGIALR